MNQMLEKVAGPADIGLAEAQAEDDGQEISSNASNRELHRELRPRQVFMFSIACAIGTGLVIGSGTGLVRGGPASMLISYILIGMAVFFVMTGLGEMAAFLPMDKGFSGYAGRMVHPAFGYATGWNYFLKYCIATPNNLTAAGLVMQYWLPDLNVGIWITIFAFFVIFINAMPVRILGETEFWASAFKVVAIATLVITCLVISVGGGPNHEPLGFRYWKSPGAFAQYLVGGKTGYFLGWWACMCQACFAYTGTEVVGMTFGELQNPRKNVPRAVKQTFWRISCFYVLSIFFLGMVVPYDSQELLGAAKRSASAAASPFVIAITSAGISAFPDIINASLLVFTISAASSDIYCASRSLYGLAKDRQAPKIFATTLGNGNPIYAVAATSLCCLLGYLNVAKSSATVFGYFTSLVTVFGVLNWTAILTSHLSFRRALTAQGISLSELPYVAFLQPYGSYYAIFVSSIVVVFNGYNAFIPHFTISTFVLEYLGTVVFVFNFLVWKLVHSYHRIPPADVDLMSGRRAF